MGTHIVQVLYQRLKQAEGDAAMVHSGDIDRWLQQQKDAVDETTVRRMRQIVEEIHARKSTRP